MATKSSATTWFNGISNQIQQRQDAYFAFHGRYWQGVPIAGAPERMKKPSDQDDDWDFLQLGASLKDDLGFFVRCDVYRAPGGHGWSLTLTLNGESRTWNFGPETHRETGGWVTNG